MILTARLFIEGHETESEGIALNYCEFSFNQEVDQRGLPVSQVKGGLIRLSYASFDDPEILFWMVSEKADKNGKIFFSGIEASKAFKILEWKDGRCISYRETFTRDSEMLTELTISVRSITVSGIDHENNWSGY